MLVCVAPLALVYSATNGKSSNVNPPPRNSSNNRRSPSTVVNPVASGAAAAGADSLGHLASAYGASNETLVLIRTATSR